jgi:hypothetical protein
MIDTTQRGGKLKFTRMNFRVQNEASQNLNDRKLEKYVLDFSQHSTRVQVV